MPIPAFVTEISAKGSQGEASLRTCFGVNFTAIARQVTQDLLETMQSAKRLLDLEVASSSLRCLVERVADAAIPEWLSRRTHTSATNAENGVDLLPPGE
jgi:hypothetical protein